MPERERRWNGWGDPRVEGPIPAQGIAFLETLTGPATPPRDLTRQEALGRAEAGGRRQRSRRASVGTSGGMSRRSAHAANPRATLPGLLTDPEIRLDHARGQSFPDWLALRGGLDLRLPDGVLLPQNATEVRRALEGAKRVGARIVVYGGGTSVVGHVNAPDTDRPVFVLNLRRMNRLLDLDPLSRLARFECGVLGPDIERQLAPQGLMLGHFPQSYEYSSLGGWIATRSSGQQSLGYGRMEDLFAGGRVLTAHGAVDLPPFPASAAGPDVRQMLLGSEGRMGVITEATVRVRAIPEAEEFRGLFFPDWESAEGFVRESGRSRSALSMLRLSSARETHVTLALAGRPGVMRMLDRYLSLRGAGEGKCLVIAGLTGSRREVSRGRSDLHARARRLGGVDLGTLLGNAWRKNRFRGPYLRNTLWERGWGVDTLESALPWQNVADAVQKVEAALQQAAASFGERILCYTHLSHVYGSGSGIYTTYVFRLDSDVRRTLGMWKRMKSAASQALVHVGGTISHQHGVGKDHIPYLRAEKGKVGMELIRSVIETADPDGLFDNGNMLAGG